MYHHSLEKVVVIRFPMIKKTAILTVLLAALVLPSVAQNKNNPLRDSLAHVSEAVEFHPDSVELRLQKAALNVQLEQWQYAKDEYDAVVRLDPHNLTAHYFRAYVNEKLHRYNFARLDYEEVLQAVPGNFEARLGLALLNQKDQHYTEALDGINQLVAAHPDSAVAWAARAGMEEERGMLELADYDYSEALARDAVNKDYLLARADIRIRLGQMEKARRDLDALVKLGTPRVALKEWYQRVR